jgi:hypothetical protein
MEATMGYYSTFEVIDTDIPDILDVLNNLDTDLDWASPGWSTWDNTVRGYDCAKWYGWIEDLQQLASLFPDNFLVIERCGEESPDVSRAVVKDGKVTEEQPTITWDYLEE